MIHIRRHDYMQKLCMYMTCMHILDVCEFVVPEQACIIIKKKSGLFKTKAAG